MQRTACHLPGQRIGFKTGKRDLLAHTHTYTPKHTPAFCLKRKSAPLLLRLKQKHTSKVFSFYSSSFFIFGNDTTSLSPAFKKPYHPLHVPFSHFLPLSKAPLRQKLYNQRCNASFSDVPFFLMVKRMDLIPRHSQTGPWERSTLRGTTAGELWACRSTLLPHYCADASHVCCLLSVMSAASAAIFPLETEYQKIIYLC